MPESKIFSYKIEYPGQIPSINQMYLIGRGRKGRTWTYLNPEIAKFKDIVVTQLLDQGIEQDYKSHGFKDPVQEIKVVIAFSKLFWRRDVTNTVKAIEDAYVTASKLDDNINTCFSITKKINDLDDKEYIICVVKVSEFIKKDHLWSSLIGAQ